MMCTASMEATSMHYKMTVRPLEDDSEEAARRCMSRRLAGGVVWSHFSSSPLVVVGLVGEERNQRKLPKNLKFPGFRPFSI